MTGLGKIKITILNVLGKNTLFYGLTVQNKMKNNLIKKKIVFVNIIIFLTLFACSRSEYNTIEIFELGDGQKFIITAPSYCDAGQFFFYEVHYKNKIIVPKTKILGISCIDSYKVSFKIVIAENGNLAGLYYEPISTLTGGFPEFEKGETWTLYTLKKHMIVIHAFDNNKSFPYKKKIFNQLFNRLSKSRPEWNADSKNVKLLKKIKRFGVYNSDPSIIHLKHLKELPGLKELSFVASNIDDSELEFLKNITGLERLTLEKTQITNKSFEHLVKLKNLKELNIHCNKVSAETVKALKKELNNTRIYPNDPEICQ